MKSLTIRTHRTPKTLVIEARGEGAEYLSHTLIAHLHLGTGDIRTWEGYDHTASRQGEAVYGCEILTYWPSNAAEELLKSL